MAQDKLRNGAGRVESTLALAASIGDSRLRGRLLDTAENCLGQLDHADEARSLLNEMRKESKPKKGQISTKVKGQLLQMLQTIKENLDGPHIELAEAACHQAIALSQTTALDDNLVPLWGLLGHFQSQLGRYDEAEAAYRKAIALNKKDARSWVGLGDLLHLHLKRYDEAEATYREAISLDGKNTRVLKTLGDLLQVHFDRYEEAEIAYRQALALDKKNAIFWIDLGKLLHLHLKRYEEAEVAYRQAIALDEKNEEKNAIVWGLLGTLLQADLERYEEAETAYRQAITLDKKNNEQNALIWNVLGTLLRDNLMRYEEAESAYRQAIALDGKHIGPWNSLGNLLQDYLGQYENALAAYQQGLAIDPQNSFLLANSAYLCALHLGQSKQARDYAKQAESGLSPAGKYLMNSVLAWSDGGTDATSRGWSELHQAVSCGDEALWSAHIDDLQRVLAYATARGDGEAVRNWMADADYPVQYAPLFHAYCSILDGEDHLLSINPEVRGMAEKIYRGLARLVELFKRKQPLVKHKPKRGRQA